MNRSLFQSHNIKNRFEYPVPKQSSQEWELKLVLYVAMSDSAGGSEAGLTEHLSYSNMAVPLQVQKEETSGLQRGTILYYHVEC